MLNVFVLGPSLTKDLYGTASSIQFWIAVFENKPGVMNDTIPHVNATSNLSRVWNSGPKNNGRAIFFNAYVPPAGVGAGPQNAIRIIKEQLKQLNESTIRDVPVYYTLIGDNITEQGDIFTSSCHMLQYVVKGSEELTIQSLYEYCTEYPSARVSYIHNKGSFNNHRKNEVRRRYVTKAVLSEACDTMASTMCNICSLDFAMLPLHHGPGNMWTGDCSYVGKLIPPKEFGNKLREMYASLETCDSNVTCAIQPDLTWPDNYLSLGRHAMELWAYSHPQVKPCVTMEEAFNKHKPRLQEWKPRLIKGPKFEKIRGIGKITASPWFRREGRLYQYDFLYDEKPPPESWFWNNYQYFKLER